MMSKSPKTVRSDELAVRAMSQLQAQRIEALFVVDDNDALVGVIHFHDLLSAGIN